MPDTPLRINHRGLGALVHELREDLDVHRLATQHRAVIRRNGDARFAPYDPVQALHSAALAASRIYGERPIGDWHSLAAVLRRLPSEGGTRRQLAAVRRFGRGHGNGDSVTDCPSFLAATYAAFRSEHRDALAQIQAFAGSRAPSSAPPLPFSGALPSLAEFDALHRFARGFHRLVGAAFAAGRPAPASRNARGRLLRLIRTAGIETARPKPGNKHR